MRIISTLEYAGTRAELQIAIDEHAAALAAHASTVGVPAPFPPSELVRELVAGAAFVLESERGWAWRSVGAMKPVAVRPAFEHETEDGETWTDSDPSGKIWDGQVLRNYTAAEIAMQASCTARQARLALHAAGLLASVEAAIQAEGGAVAIEWEYATTIERASPLVASMAQSLGLTEPQLDALFTQAAAL